MKLKKLKERIKYLLNASNRHEAILQEMRAELNELNTSQSNNLEVGNDINVVSKADYAVELLRQYAMENQTLIRGTSDLSPLEQWLLMKLSKRITKEQLLELFVEYSCAATDQAGCKLLVIDSDDFQELAEKIIELQGEK